MSLLGKFTSWFLRNHGYKEIDSDALDKTITTSIGNSASNLWDNFRNGISNWWKGFTGSGLTQRDIDLNAMNMQNVEDQASAEVAGYKKAGVNPALMFSGGSNTAPSSSSSGTPGNMSELLQSLMIPAQLRMLKAQTENVRANTAKTQVETEKTGSEIDEIKAKVKSLGISNEQQSVILGYLDRMQSAELAIKNASKERIDADIRSIEQSINNMSAEECATYVSMCETIERINSLQSQQNLNADQGAYYAKLVDNLEEQNKILRLQQRDWDYINVIGSTSVTTGLGPFKGSESHPLTLHDLKNRAEKVGEEKAKQDKSNNKSWEQIKKDASDRYGALE